MKVLKIEEHGYESALLGLSLSFYDHQNDLTEWWSDEKKARAAKRAEALAFKGGGHNKFLESIQVWLFIQAPRSFWSEFDTYRVGMTKQSASTMHTIDKRFVDVFDFEYGTDPEAIQAFNNRLVEYRDPNDKWFKDVTRLKDNLPEGWLQERVVCTNYMVLQNILRQRIKHRLRHWRSEFCDTILREVDHPELLSEAKR